MHYELRIFYHALDMIDEWISDRRNNTSLFTACKSKHEPTKITTSRHQGTSFFSFLWFFAATSSTRFPMRKAHPSSQSLEMLLTDNGSIKIFILSVWRKILSRNSRLSAVELWLCPKPFCQLYWDMTTKINFLAAWYLLFPSEVGSWFGYSKTHPRR